MSLAEFTALLVTPVLFLGWGVLLGIPEDEREARSPGESWWQEPRVFGGIVAIVMALFTSSAFTDGGDIAMFVALPAAVLMASGWGFALWLRRKPIRSEDTATSPRPTDEAG